MAEHVAAALSSLNIGLVSPRLNPELGVAGNSIDSDSWILLVQDDSQLACSVWLPNSTGPLLLPLFAPGGTKFVPLASSGGLIFGREKEGTKRFLVGNPVTGAWKCIPSPLAEAEDNEEDPEEVEEEEEAEYDMCREYDREGRITEYRMLVDQHQSNKYWIIGIAENNLGAWDSWEEIDLLYEYDSKLGTWREVDMLNYGPGHDCSVSEEEPDDLNSCIVLAWSGLYDPKRHVLHGIPNPEDAGCFQNWGGAVLCTKDKKLVIGSSGPEDEIRLWLQTGAVSTELAKYKCSLPSGNHRWYEGGNDYVTLSHEGPGCFAYHLLHQTWHQIDNNATLLHFSPSLTAAP